MIFGVCPTISFAEDSTKYAAVIDTAVVKNSNGTTVSLKINGLPKDSVYNSVCVLSADNDISDGISRRRFQRLYMYPTILKILQAMNISL